MVHPIPVDAFAAEADRLYLVFCPGQGGWRVGEWWTVDGPRRWVLARDVSVDLRVSHMVDVLADPFRAADMIRWTLLRQIEPAGRHIAIISVAESGTRNAGEQPLRHPKRESENQMTPHRKTSRRPTAEDLSGIRKLRELRRAERKSQAWIADIVGITAQQWGKYERGEDRIPIGRYQIALAALQQAAQARRARQAPEEEMAFHQTNMLNDSDAADLRIIRDALDRIEARRRRS